jgi:acyl carrier protein
MHKVGAQMMDVKDNTDTIIRSILADLLGLSAAQVAVMDAGTELFGALPELDSMAVAGLLTEMEDRLGITIDDDDVDGELFATFGNLVEFAKAKLTD